MEARGRSTKMILNLIRLRENPATVSNICARFLGLRVDPVK